MRIDIVEELTELYPELNYLPSMGMKVNKIVERFKDKYEGDKSDIFLTWLGFYAGYYQGANDTIDIMFKRCMTMEHNLDIPFVLGEFEKEKERGEKEYTRENGHKLVAELDIDINEKLEIGEQWDKRKDYLDECETMLDADVKLLKERLRRV